MTSRLTVSAVIPVHNGEAFVAEAIRSTLEQTRPPIECLVIDDGSTDATAEVVRGFGGDVTYVGQDRSGVAAARNRGAELARGALVSFLDHDDKWAPAKLERQVEVLDVQNAGMALCAVSVVDANGTALRTIRLRTPGDFVTGMLMFDGTETVSCSSAGLVHRGRFLSSGGFDRALSMSADWDLLLRTLLRDRVAYVDEALVIYRVHETNMSRNIAAMEHDMTYAFAKTFADPNLPAALRDRRRRAYSRLYRMLAGSYRDSGQMRAAARAFALAIRYDPSAVFELARGARARR